MGVSKAVDVLEWWKGHEQELSHWVAAFKLIELVQPSSAACERVFSLLANSPFNQERAMEDYIQLSVMLQYVLYNINLGSFLKNNRLNLWESGSRIIDKILSMIFTTSTPGA